MGRGKLEMKFITNEKIRMSTYHKRKKGLIKKANEFSILCGVDTCMIIYGPKIKDNPAKLEIWPSDPAQVMNVINKYIDMPLDVRGKKCFNVYDSFASRQKKIYREIYKQREANLEAKFPTWDDSLNNLSGDQLSALLARLDSNIEAAKKKIAVMKGNLHQSLVEIDSKSELFATQPRFNLSNQAGLDIDVTWQRQHPITGHKPFVMNVPSSYYPFNPGKALQVQPLKMLSTNGLDSFNQVDGGESSSSITYTSLSPQPQTYHDPIASMLDNVPPFNNNPWGVGLPFCLYTPFVQQPTTTFGQYSPATSSFPSHQFGEFYHDMDDQQGPKNKE